MIPYSYTRLFPDLTDEAGADCVVLTHRFCLCKFLSEEQDPSIELKSVYAHFHHDSID